MADQNDTSHHAELVSISTVYDSTTAEIIRLQLENEGIRCVIDGELQAGLAGALPIHVQVDKPDADRAREIVQRIQGE